MKKVLSVMFLLFFSLITNYSFSQENTPTIGFRMKSSTDDLKVYRDDNGHPDLSVYKVINNSVWYKHIGTDTLTYNNEKYFLIRIPEGEGKPDKDLKPWTQADKASNVSSIDYNIPLWIKLSDFYKYYKVEYARYESQFIFGGLTVPFRIRPSIDDYPSSIFNGDFNVGAYAGMRAAFGDRFGISFIGSLGLSSLNQNASNNKGIKDTTSQSMFALTYGVGFVFDWAKKFQLGAVIGRDNGFDKLSTTYIYQNRTWFAISLNYKFLGDYKTDENKDQ